MHPYGFCSLAPDGTTQVVARQGEHFGNRLVLGHRAADRPKDLKSGETAAYSKSGYKIVWKGDSVMIGHGSTLEPLVMGQALNDLLKSLLNALIAHTHAAPGVPPTNVADFTTILTSKLNSNKILVKDGGAF
jgi:phage gp45-like